MDANVLVQSSVESSVKTEASYTSQIKPDDCPVAVDVSESDALNLIKKEEKVKPDTDVVTSYVELYVESYNVELKHKADVTPNVLKYEQAPVSVSTSNRPVLQSQEGDKSISDDVVKSSDETFTCDACSYQSKSKSSLKSHKYRVHSTKPLQTCRLCSYKTRIVAEFQNHMKRHTKQHKRSEPFKCPYCDSEFLWATTLVQHSITKHNNSQPFCCMRCNSKFSALKKFKRHEEKCHPRQLFPCDFSGCKKIFKKRQYLSDHMKTHMNNTPYVDCDICNETFSNGEELKQHLQSIHQLPHQLHQNIEFPCDFPGCDESFTESNSLLNHRQVHDVPAYECKDCKKRYKLEGNFQKHKCDQKRNRVNKKQISNCEECGDIFSSKVLLNQHTKSSKCSGTLTRIEDKTCSGCNELFPTKAFLIRHENYCVFC